MARPSRNETEGGLYHVTARGIAQRSIFRDAVDREMYLTTLARVIKQMGWRCLGYCLMDNHLHLILELDKPNLGRGMRRLHGAYATAYNVRYGLSGHVFQGRYHAVLITSDEQLMAVAAYVARNPVQAGLVERAEFWRWGSHGSVVDGNGPDWLDVERLLAFFASWGGDPVARYREAVVAGFRGDGGDGGDGAVIAG